MIYEFLADGFEEIEALTPIDMLRRAGKDIKTVSLKTDRLVTGAHGIKVTADITLKDIDTLPELVILPGGMPGSKNLRASREVCKCVTDTYENGGFVAAICAAPFILGELGILRGKKVTCYPGFENSLEGAAEIGGRVVRDGRIITAVGMGAALEFSYEIISALCGVDEAERLMKAVIAK